MDDNILDYFCNNQGADQQAVLQYFEHLKQLENGWQQCMNAIVNRSYINNDQAYFFLLQVVEHHLKTRYHNASVEESLYVRNCLLNWIQNLNVYPERRNFIMNKFSQLFVLAFLSDYPSKWPSFFNDLLVVMNLGSNVDHEAVDVYFRVLLALHEEVVDKDIPHTEQELKRNTVVKDFMREHSVNLMVSSWYEVLATYEPLLPSLSPSPRITVSCLDTVGKYVSWIDISLIANDRFVGMILGLMGGKSGSSIRPVAVKSAACNCLSQIVSKGMDSSLKVKLVESIAEVLDRAGLICVPESDGGDEEDEHVVAFAELVSCFGNQLAQCWQKFTKDKDLQKARVAFDAIKSKMVLLLKLFSHDDDDVSKCIIPFISSYIGILKNLPPCATFNDRSDFVKSVLPILMKKMKYDDEHDFDDEDDGEFEEFRKELKILYINLSTLECDLFLETVNHNFTDALQKMQFSKFNEVEVAIYFLYLLGEIIPLSGQGNKVYKIPEDRIVLLHDMIKKMILSNVSCYPHHSVQLQFFETVVRYEKFFSTPEFIPEVLKAFLDERGLWNAHCQVRSRVSYLFSRFVKSINKQHIQEYLEMILTRIQGLLVINTSNVAFEQKSGDRSCLNNNTSASHLSVEDQQFMFETASVLIIQSSFTPEKKHDLMRSLVFPILGQFNDMLLQMMSERDENVQVYLAQLLNSAMSFISRTSKGFSGHQTVHSNGCLDVFVQAMNVFIKVLKVPVQQQTLHQGFRQFLHRMVICLDRDVLQFTPAVVEGLMMSASIKQLHDFIPFLNQLIQKFKKIIVEYMQQIFVPILTIIQNALCTAVEENDQVTRMEKKMLQAGYFSFISVIMNNETSEILSSQNIESLEVVFNTLMQGAADCSDPTSQRICFGILKKMVETWDGNEAVPGFRKFTYEKIIPCCFITPLQPTFNISDAQAILTLSDIASCLLKIHEKQGKDLIQYLNFSYLPSLNIPPLSAEDFCRNLSNSDAKGFQNYSKAFFTQLHIIRS